MTYFVGVDVGTGSVRAALVDGVGRILKKSTNPIKTWNPEADFYQQSSEDIWRSCCKVVREVTQGVQSSEIGGIGFDATCSLVAVDANGLPLSVSKNGEREQNVILWMDHRAKKEADFINSKNHPILKNVGGKISLEMEIPKILWLKNNLPKDKFWNEVGYFFDLPDFLTWKATKAVSRSLCTAVCKWTYCAEQPSAGYWDRSYFKDIGLDDLSKNNWSAIGNEIVEPGRPCGNGMTGDAAKEMGLKVGTPVATALIDAHAGGLGMIGVGLKNQVPDFKNRLVMICGTSTCHMLLSDKQVFVNGVWGPYFGAMVPDMWLLEGGQSATGKLIDHIIDTHPATGKLKIPKGTRVEDYLNTLLEKISAEKGLDSIDRLTENFHVYPDFHGNRSPVADPTLKGMVVGLTLSADQENLALVYLATIQALCYGTKHIIKSIEDSAECMAIKEILVCGGLGRNSVFLQCQANVATLPVRTSTEDDPVLVGAAMLAAAASSSRCPNALGDIVVAMAGDPRTIRPSTGTKEYHNRKYAVYLEMLKDQQKYKDLMSIS